MADFWIKCLILTKGSVNEETKLTIFNLDPNPILFEESKRVDNYQKDINNDIKWHNNFTNEKNNKQYFC